MTAAEQNARAYCLSIQTDPDQAVKSWHGYKGGGGYFTTAPRWTLYLGAVIQQQHAAE